MIRIALGLSTLLLAGAFLPHHSYNYFILLKWVVFLTAVWAASKLSKNQSLAFFIFVGVAILHNPFLKFHFSRDTWLVFDGISALTFLLSITNKTLAQK